MKQREIQQFFTIRNAESVDGEMFLEGISEPGAPNKRGLMLDAETSWPYIEAYVSEFEARTEGASKGALRAMHDEKREVGKIVNVDLSQAPALPVRVHVVSEEAKRFVEERVLNAFSWNWAVVGSMWEDKEASKQFGRKVMKYTGRPIELSLVDAPGIPETGFHVVANFDEGEDMSEPVPAPAEKPEAVPEQVQNADPAQPETVANGIYTAGRLGEALEHITYIKEAIAREEAAEGANSPVLGKMKAIVSDFAEVWSEYTAEQAKELIADGKDFDPFDVEGEDEGVENADKPAPGASAMAHRASVKAIANGSAEGHEAAALAHKKAAVSSEKAGKGKMAAFHRAQQKYHKDAVENCSQANSDKPASVQNSDASEILAELAKLTERIAALEVSNSDKPAAPAPIPAPIAVFHDEEQVTNGDASRAPAPIRYQDHSGKSLEQIRQSITQH